jgi:hypothetical protein
MRFKKLHEFQTILKAEILSESILFPSQIEKPFLR